MLKEGPLREDIIIETEGEIIILFETTLTGENVLCQGIATGMKGEEIETEGDLHLEIVPIRETQKTKIQKIKIHALSQEATLQQDAPGQRKEKCQ